MTDPAPTLDRSARRALRELTEGRRPWHVRSWRAAMNVCGYLLAATSVLALISLFIAAIVWAWRVVLS